MMKKLYKEIDGVWHYQEAWTHEGKCTYHWGQLGTTGQSKVLRIDGKQLKEPAIENVLAEAAREGYAEIAPEKHFQMVVQRKTADEWGDSSDLDDRYLIEEILNECLGWTGNGFCDGGDIGSGTINVFSFVVDPHLACKTIIKELRLNQFLDGSVIAYRDYDDNYHVLWPEGHAEPFSII